MAAERRLVILVGAGVTACRRMGLMSDAERGERGMAVRRQVLGDEHVDRATAGATEFTAPFQDLITRYAWGEIWSRPGLTRPERSMITITALAALRQEEELALHLRAALRNGLTEAQIQEVLLQVAIYAGVPAANRAFAIAQRVLAEVSGQPGEATPDTP
jgi:4-carboxymuconolactone decarboxylase